MYAFPITDTPYHTYGPGDGWGVYGFAETLLGGASAGARYGSGDGGAGVDTARAVGEDDWKYGWYPYIRCLVGAADRSCPCPGASAVWGTHSRIEDGRRCWIALVSWTGRYKGSTIPAGCCDPFLGTQIACAWVDERRRVNCVG